MKQLRKYYRYELTYSVDLNKYLIEGEMEVVEYLQKMVKTKNFEKGRRILNIYKCLEEYWPFDEFEYGDDTYLTTARKIYTESQKRIEKYMHKKFQKGLLGDRSKPFHTSNEAFLEQVARGFLPLDKLINSADHKKTYHLKSTILPIFLGNFKDSAEAIDYQKRCGVEGYTGFNSPTNN